MLMIKYIQLRTFKISTVIFLLFLKVTLNAQYSEEYTTFSEKYPDAVKVRLLQETIVKIEINKGTLNISEESIEKDLYLNESVTFNSEESISYSHFFDLENIEASSFLYKDGKYREIEVEKFKEKDNLDNSFYDDTKIVRFIYPNLKKGSISELKHTYRIKNPRFLNAFYFGDGFPIAKSKITYIVDKDVNIDFKKFNISEDKIKFVKKEKRGSIIYTWEVMNQEEHDFEQGAPSFRTVLPHIIPIITSYKYKNKKVELLGGVSDLYKWYYSLVKDVNKETTDAELIAITKEIIKDKPNDLEKVKAIFYWAQKNIKYIAFEYALGGFIPRESNEVYRKKYGDCKDNSSILFKMLEIANLKGSLTWIGTRSIPYTYEEVPTPIVDNHMILSYEHNDKTYFLDATGRYIKFGLPTSFIQGKEALIANGNTFKVKKVPIIAATENSIIDSSRIKLENDRIVGVSKTIISGYPKIFYFNKLENKTKEDELKQFYNAGLRKGNNKFLILNLKEKNKFNYDEDLEVDYDFEIDNYSKKLGDEIYINLNLNKKLSDYKVEKKRKNAIEYNYKRYYDYNTVFEVPENYKVDYLPKNINISNDLLSCTIDYELKGDEIKYNQKIILNYLVLDLPQQKKVNELIKKIEKNYKEIVVLKKK